VFRSKTALNMSNAVKFVLAVVCGAHTLALGSEVIELENLAGEHRNPQRDGGEDA
jgi:hypothetical protein